MKSLSEVGLTGLGDTVHVGDDGVKFEEDLHDSFLINWMDGSDIAFRDNGEALRLRWA